MLSVCAACSIISVLIQWGATLVINLGEKVTPLRSKVTENMLHVHVHAHAHAYVHATGYEVIRRVATVNVTVCSLS